MTYQWQFNGTNLPNLGLITTVAGGGSPILGSIGDGGAATNAKLSQPFSVVFDAYGNLYIADYQTFRIRKVDTNGIITTFAGKGGRPTFAGDGGAATNANLALPSGVAFDASGNQFIADYGNGRVRKVDTNSIITTVAGGGAGGDGSAATNASLNGPFGVAFDASGNLFIADLGNNRIRRVDTNGIINTVAGNGTATFAGDGGTATNASLYNPSSVACDPFGNLFIADTGNNCIRKVDTNGVITTVAGNGTNSYSGAGGVATNASLSGPTGVDCDPFGNVFIADNGNSLIRKVDTSGFITTVAGNGTNSYSGDGGAATNAGLSNPVGVTFDASGNLFIADRYNTRVRKVLLYAGYPTLTLNNIVAANAGNYTVVVTGSFGSVTSVVATLTVSAPGVITSPPASQVTVVGASPGFSVAVAGSGPFGYKWYFAATNLVQSGTNNTLTLPNVTTNNAGNYTVVITNNYGSVTSQVATLLVLLPIQPASLTNLAGTTLILNVGTNETGPFNYQWQFNGANLPNNIITTVAGIGPSGNNSGSYSGDGGAATNAGINNPIAMAFDASGNLFFADFYTSRVRKVDTNGIITTAVGGGTNGLGDGGAATNASINLPQGVAIDASGNLFVDDCFNCRIRKVDINGIITTVAGNGTNGYSGDGGAATNASINAPFGVSCDASGSLFIADTYNGRVRKVDSNGIITTVAGNGSGTFAGDGGAATNASLYYPQDMVSDAFGNLFIADWGNGRIRKVDSHCIITTVAGNGGHGYSGDGGPAIGSNLDPTGVAFDAYGNMFIADYRNQRVRKVDTNGIITTVAGNGTATYAGDGGAATNASLWNPQRVAFDVRGNLFIGDSLNNRVREVHFAGYPTLTLNNIGATNAGNYTVVVSGTSAYGSVTSLVATLTVIVPPQIIASGTNFGFVSNQFGFNLNGTSNQIIVVDGSTNLVNWRPLYTNTATGNPFYFSDPAWTNFPWRFYRARLP